MRVIGTVVVRNEADVLRLSVAHHLSLGLDAVLVADNGSTDGTVRVLERLSRADGRVQWTSDPAPDNETSLRTELAREAYRHGADWVVPFDADEFWWAAGGSLRARLGAATAGALGAEAVNFVQQRGQLVASEAGLRAMIRRPLRRIDDGRLRVEGGQLAFIELRYPPKWISRPTSDIVIQPGNHAVLGADGPAEERFDLAVLHAPCAAASA